MMYTGNLLFIRETLSIRKGGIFSFRMFDDPYVEFNNEMRSEEDAF